MSSNANYDFVVGHHPIFGTADTLFGTNVSSSNGFADLGNPTAEGTASFAEVLRLIRQYKPVSDASLSAPASSQQCIDGLHQENIMPMGPFSSSGYWLTSHFVLTLQAAYLNGHVSTCFCAAGCLPEWSRPRHGSGHRRAIPGAQPHTVHHDWSW